MEPTDAQVAAALAYFLAEGDPPPGYHRSARDFIAGPDDPPPGSPEREAAVAALQDADRAAEAELREYVRRLLRAVLDA